jgi:hypothetical protein
MLAAGCIPVVNDAEHNKLVLDNAFVRYAPLDPHALAAELERIVATKDFDVLSKQAAASVQSRAWEEAGKQVDAILRRELKCDQAVRVALQTT